MNACLRADSQTGEVRPGQLHVAIIGAGATGTELAAELHHTIREVVGQGLDRIDPVRDVRIVLIEAADRILPALSERIAGKAGEMLAKLSVDVRVKSRVAEVMADGVRLSDGTVVPSELIVWSAGVKGPDFLRSLDGLEVTRSNQLVVLPTLQTTHDPDVFAMGDCAATPRPGYDTPVPPRAQAAHQQASHLLRQLRARLDGRPLQPFHYRDFGSLVSLGRNHTVGSLMARTASNMFIEGLLARMMYRSLYKMHERALHGTARTAVRALGRSLTGRSEPLVKLH